MRYRYVKILGFLLFTLQSVLLNAQSNVDDYWINHPVTPFSSGQTITTNSGFFYDDGGYDLYQTNQDWSVRFCSENGNPLTVDFNGFRTHYVGAIPGGDNFLNYDYLRIQYPGANWSVYYNDTPQLSFTSPDGCMNFRFISQSDSPRDSGWIGEISAIPPPPNNDPCTAAPLPVGNVCSPSYFSNKGAFNTTTLGSPQCKAYFGGDVWFTAVVPLSGQLKLETFPGSLKYGIMVLYTGSCSSLTYVSCIDIVNSMPSTIYHGIAGTQVTVRIFGEQAKSGTFGICATDPAAPITGFTGPGGVGDSVSNKLWIRADKGVQNDADNMAIDGDGIKTWKDFSGKSNDLLQTVASNRATFTSNAISTMPALRFDGTDDQYNLTLDPLSAPVSVFAVNKFLEGNKDQTLIALGNATDDNTFSISRESDERYYSFTGSRLYGPDISGSDASIFYVNHKSLTPFHKLSINSAEQSVLNYGDAITTNGYLNLGKSKDISGYLNGEIGEVIIYSKFLNLAQEIIVHNYLAAKYDINIGVSGRYTHSATHRHDVAGIGRVNAGNIHTKAQSAGILAIGGADDLEDGEFLLFGHDRKDISSWVSDGVPYGDINLLRIERTWRADISGGDGVGNVSISLNDSLLPPFEPGFIAYNIFVNNVSDFSTGATAYGLVRSGDEYVANNVPLNNGDYITIAAVRPFVNFVTDSSSGFENLPNPIILTELNYAISEQFEVDYAVTGGTATGGGVDYSLNPGKLVFNPGQKSQNIVPLIIDDNILEIPDEYFIIGLSNPTAGVQLGSIITHTYTILNNDIEISIVSAQPTIGSCETSKDTLNATTTGTGPFTYSWFPTGGLSHPTESITQAKPLATTKYILTVTDANGFSDIDSIVVNVDPLPVKPVISPSGTVNIIYGDSVTLTSTPADGYLWSTGNTSQSVVVKHSGQYFLKTIDIYGCESETSDTTIVNSGSLQITVTADSGQGKVYGEADPVLTYSVTSGSLLAGDSFTGELIRIPGENVGNYTIQMGSLTAGLNYDIIFVSAEFTISPKSLTVSNISARDKQYDGNTSATLSISGYTLTGIVGEEVVDLDTTSFSASFDTKDIGTNKPVTVTGLSLGGEDAGNYTLTQLTGLSADITAKALTISGITANSKVYDGTTEATLTINGYIINDIIGTEIVFLDTSSYIANFDTKDIGINKPVVITTLGLNGADAGNYILNQPTGLIADITAKALTVSGITVNDKEYDGTTIATLTTSGYSLNGIEGGESVVLDLSSYSASFDTKIAEINKTVTITGIILDGADAGNYTFTLPFGLTADITLRTLTLSNFTVSNKEYDGTTTVSGTGFDDDRIPGDLLEFTFDAAFDNADPGVDKLVNYTNIVISGGADKDNYILASETGSALADIYEDIPEKPLITASGPVIFCAGGSVELTSSLAESYLWSTGDTTRTIIVQTSGVYHVVVKTLAGAVSLPSESVMVTVNPNPQLSLNKTDVSCFGGSDGAVNAVASGGTLPYTYAWSNNGVTSTIENLSTGTYTLNLSDANSCSVSAQTTINQPSQINIVETVTSAYCPDSDDGHIDIAVSGGVGPYLYSWSTGWTGQNLSDVTHGDYTVTVTDANNCQVLKAIGISWTHDICFRIPDIITPNGDGRNDDWIIEGLQFYPDVSVEIYNRWGKRVFYSKPYERNWDGSFEGKELPMDSYHYIINLNNGTSPIIGNITIVR